ncbi:alginate O-acetyltransferase AlgX-related protein [Agrococcus jejuensis]|uniref:SGNH hydrolase-like domain-containing protein, acetyltransferase AlgX n=1 Tax=Agrococcus jejuensis TaxID=399736 RepID=A0A1G8FHU7_9MICO|nr:hypothetical protein [Agrococcus jejuensis]SDH81703.1 SGNH hydrolase-like domain-containing protein, acetyltransferase AlgX [Agrococcus jejuensis]
MSDSLRELPPDQEIRGSRWKRLRLVPLSILVVLAVAAAAAGGIWHAQHPLGSGVPVSTGEPGTGLPDACTPAFDRALPGGDPWGADADASEAVFQSHAAEVEGPAVAGQDGQWFFGDANWHDFSQSLGREPLSDERIEAWYAYLNNMRSELDAIDVPLYVVVAPAKWEILHEDLPEWAQPLRGEVRIDQLMQAHPDLPFVDVRAALASAQQETDTYTPLNSHWTPFGAYAAFQTVADCLGAADERMDAIQPPTIEGVTFSNDYDEFGPLGQQVTVGQDWTTPIYAESRGEMTATLNDGSVQQLPVESPLDMLQLPATTQNPNAQVDLSALMIRDSTGNAMGPMLQDAFAETTQIRHFLDEPANMPDVVQAATDSGADVAILVLTERYLDIVPGVGMAP